MNADPATMEFMPAPLSREESDQAFERITNHWRKPEFGLWAVEHRAAGELIGFIGLSIPGFAAHFTPAVEIGWRLASSWWGHGLATEGAHSTARHAFESLQFEELVSFTVPANLRSRRVMEKLGMTHDPLDDFDHPNLPPGHPFRWHVLHRLRRQAASTGGSTSHPAPDCHQEP